MLAPHYIQPIQRIVVTSRPKALFGYPSGQLCALLCSKTHSAQVLSVALTHMADTASGEIDHEN